jgi:ABC-type lipoprotein release transport system permease subunit
MELLRYMTSNVLKRPLRALFVVVAGLLSSLVLVFTFALGSKVTTHIRENTIARWTGHLWVSPQTDFHFDENDFDRYGQEARAIRDYLGRNPNVSIAVPWTQIGVEIQAGTAREYVQVSATDFDRDLPLRANTEMVEGRFPGPDEEYTVVITTELAQKFRLKVGDSIVCFISSVYGARNAMDFTITGIERAAAPWYDNNITIRAQDFVTMREWGDSFPFAKVYVKDEGGIPAMVKDLRVLAPDFKVDGYRDDQFVRFLLSLGTTDIMFFGFMALIIFLALLIGIRSVVLTNIFDRRDEIGTLRALGFPRGTVRNLFFGESVVELLVGYLGGAILVVAIGVVFQARIVRPPLLMLQYMFGMTRMSLTLDAFSLVTPLFLLLGLLLLTTFRTVGKETEKQAVQQMANR